MMSAGSSRWTNSPGTGAVTPRRCCSIAPPRTSCTPRTANPSGVGYVERGFLFNASCHTLSTDSETAGGALAQQARAIRTRRTILESAAAVFAERGYERTTIGEILVRAGVTKGALYFH